MLCNLIQSSEYVITGTTYICIHERLRPFVKNKPTVFLIYAV